MSTPHHSGNEFKRFMDQHMGVARREYPQGRIGADDDGSLDFAIATDTKHGVVRIAFPKPVEWIALRAEDVERLRDELTDRLLELRGVTTE